MKELNCHVRFFVAFLVVFSLSGCISDQGEFYYSDGKLTIDLRNLEREDVCVNGAMILKKDKSSNRVDLFYSFPADEIGVTCLQLAEIVPSDFDARRFDYFADFDTGDRGKRYSLKLEFR